MVSTQKAKLFVIDNLIWIILLGVYVGFGVISPNMFNPSLFIYIVFSSIPLGFIILAEAVTLLSGNFDVSVGEIAGFSAMLSAFIIVRLGFSAPVYVLVFIPLLIGTGCGALNGFFVGKLKLNPFLATLGTNLLWFGATLQVSATVISGLPDSYLILGGVGWVTILVFAATVLILYLVFSKTTFGYHFLAVGSDPRTSKTMGVNPGKYYFWAFLIAGFFSGLAGLAYTGYLTAVPPMVADNTVFYAFAGAIMGGISLKGGKGSIINVVGGCLLMATFESGLAMINISPFMRKVSLGLLVVAAIIINLVRDRLRDQILLPHK